MDATSEMCCGHAGVLGSSSTHPRRGARQPGGGCAFHPPKPPWTCIVSSHAYMIETTAIFTAHPRLGAGHLVCRRPPPPAACPLRFPGRTGAGIRRIRRAPNEAGPVIAKGLSSVTVAEPGTHTPGAPDLSLLQAADAHAHACLLAAPLLPQPTLPLPCTRVQAC